MAHNRFKSFKEIEEFANTDCGIYSFMEWVVNSQKNIMKN